MKGEAPAGSAVATAPAEPGHPDPTPLRKGQQRCSVTGTPHLLQRPMGSLNTSANFPSLSLSLPLSQADVRMHGDS